MNACKRTAKLRRIRNTAVAGDTGRGGEAARQRRASALIEKLKQDGNWRLRRAARA